MPHIIKCGEGTNRDIAINELFNATTHLITDSRKCIANHNYIDNVYAVV